MNSVETTLDPNIFELKFPLTFKENYDGGINFTDEIKRLEEDLWHTIHFDESGRISVDREKKKELYKNLMTDTYGPNFFDENGIALVTGGIILSLAYGENGKPIGFHPEVIPDLFVNESGESIFGDNRLLYREKQRTRKEYAPKDINLMYSEKISYRVAKRGCVYLLYDQDKTFGVTNFGENYFENAVVWTPKIGRLNNGEPVDTVNFNFAEKKGVVIITAYDNKHIYLDQEGNEIEKPDRYSEKISFKGILKDVLKTIKPKKNN